MAQDCTVCLVEHDEEIHAATTRVHAWFRTQVTKHLHYAADDPMANEGNELCGAVIRPPVPGQGSSASDPVEVSFLIGPERPSSLFENQPLLERPGARPEVV
jgi:hypothetical protein